MLLLLKNCNLKVSFSAKTPKNTCFGGKKTFLCHYKVPCLRYQKEDCNHVHESEQKQMETARRFVLFLSVWQLGANKLDTITPGFGDV